MQTFTVNGRAVRVRAVHCGTVTIKRCHATCCLPERTPSALRLLAILADRRFAPPMPIWSYVIEHPDGLFVVDAGASPSYNDPHSWRPDPRTGTVIRSFIKLTVQEGAALPERMADAGLDPENVRALVLTHQHVDHTGTVPSFPRADIWTTRAEDLAAGRIGALHWRWRDGSTRIRHVDVEGTATDLGTAVMLTDDGSLSAIHTPGHTPGSVTVRLTTDQTDIWFTGDTSFTADGMDPAAPTAGIHTDMRRVRALQSRLRDAGLILPSHDPTVPARLGSASVGVSQ
ncbi:N-acyl homoserine lactonase [Mycolicibacterium chlorophenolicum]|uniref:N-acyl homoserine lactonase n=1 Tax=Mycolicibacterium chlorophenolicum TaxID=37916 RepID=A0A0J6W9N9_9MYCO|nr:N-acyl homoserine lactonase [Mycolicibacterium chlorophenolicum]